MKTVMCGSSFCIKHGLVWCLQTHSDVSWDFTAALTDGHCVHTLFYPLSQSTHTVDSIQLFTLSVKRKNIKSTFYLTFLLFEEDQLLLQQTNGGCCRGCRPVLTGSEGLRVKVESG